MPVFFHVIGSSRTAAAWVSKSPVRQRSLLDLHTPARRSACTCDGHTPSWEVARSAAGTSAARVVGRSRLCAGG
jgi:hypothetical protein